VAATRYRPSAGVLSARTSLPHGSVQRSASYSLSTEAAASESGMCSSAPRSVHTSDRVVGCENVCVCACVCVHVCVCVCVHACMRERARESKVVPTNHAPIATHSKATNSPHLRSSSQTLPSAPGGGPQVRVVCVWSIQAQPFLRRITQRHRDSTASLHCGALRLEHALHVYAHQHCTLLRRVPSVC
jgi:hypothetical protein